MRREAPKQTRLQFTSTVPSRAFDEDFNTIPRSEKILYCVVAHALTQLLCLTLGTLASYLSPIPFYWGVVVYHITGSCAYLTHWFGHRKEAGPWFVAHTIEHHIRLYPPQKFLNKDQLSSNDPNAKYYLPSFVVPMCITYYVTQSVSGCCFCAALVLFFAWLVDYFHAGFHLENCWMEKYRVFVAFREIHYWHHKGHMKHNFGITDLYIDWVCNNLILGT